MRASFSAQVGVSIAHRSAADWLTDVDGHEYVDLVGSWGPMLLGHAHPECRRPCRPPIATGRRTAPRPSPRVELAEVVRRTRSTACGFVSSGTEATMSAIRLARGYTGRDVVVKFAGCYHGHVDSLLASAGSGLATFAVPGTPGVPSRRPHSPSCCPTTTAPPSPAAFAEHGERIAYLITEAAPGNMGVVPPESGWNRFLARVVPTTGRCSSPTR
ncbi:MAG: aminotransferase class III-fold pyridoxal phosphate-dependent enzyme [Nocardioides sp.]